MSGNLELILFSASVEFLRYQHQMCMLLSEIQRHIPGICGEFIGEGNQGVSADGNLDHLEESELRRRSFISGIAVGSLRGPAICQFCLCTSREILFFRRVGKNKAAEQRLNSLPG